MDLSQFSTVLRAYQLLNSEGEWNSELSQALVSLVDSVNGPLTPPGDYPPRETEPTSGLTPNTPHSNSSTYSANHTPDQKPLPALLPRDHPKHTKTDQLQNKKKKANLTALKSTLYLIANEADIELNEAERNQPERGKQSPDLNFETVRPPVENLFPETRVRGILREMAMVPTARGRINVETAVNLVASGKPLCELPEEILSGMPPAVHWLFDTAPSMLPFSRDKQQLAHTAPRLLGNERTHIADFIGDPKKGVRLRRKVRWESFHWPARKSAVVVVSDLGIRDPAGLKSLTARAWETFLEEAESKEINVVLLNPYMPDRWPEFARCFPIALSWDSATGVQQLRRNRRRAEIA